MKRPTASLTLIALAAAILLAAASGIAYASIPGPDGVIQGCYLKSGGSLRVIDSSASCKSTETSLNWNQSGLPGPPGPSGTNGMNGATGPTGPTGPSGPGVKTIAGEVFDNGFIAEGSGFSVSKVSIGGYDIKFPPGTWSGCIDPVVTVTPFGDGVVANWVGAGCGNDGSAVFHVLLDTVGSSPHTVDDDFVFMAVQP
jgi:hypothetical protein